MSLDVYLTGAPELVPCKCQCGHEHTRARTEYHFEANITHNLGKMAGAAGIYLALWRPEEIGITTAGQLVPLLEAGLKLLNQGRKGFVQFEAVNGWGTYEVFVPWVQCYLAACQRWPEAKVSVSR